MAWSTPLTRLLSEGSWLGARLTPSPMNTPMGRMVAAIKRMLKTFGDGLVILLCGGSWWFGGGVWVFVAVWWSLWLLWLWWLSFRCSG